MAGSGGPSSWDGEDEGQSAILAEINITPLTDLFLVLLTIFMITSSVMIQNGVEVKLPSASQTLSQSQPEGVILTFVSEREVRINGEAVSGGDLKALEAPIQKALAQAKNKLVILEGDRAALLGSVIALMDVAKRAGAEQFSIATSGDTDKK